MGADEQLGGYGRHRKPHRDGTLREELDLDINRIWERNMGRDDRLLSDHGKEARFHAWIQMSSSFWPMCLLMISVTSRQNRAEETSGYYN
jgi:asparagine synthetase B (glutamine-hydrolysing)